MRALDEHTKLARAAIDFGPALDAQFEINVTKGRYSLPQELKDALKSTVDDFMRQARSVYDKSESKRAPRRPANGLPPKNPDGIPPKQPSRRLHLRQALVQAAKTARKAVAFSKIVQVLRRDRPSEAHELGF